MNSQMPHAPAKIEESMMRADTGAPEGFQFKAADLVEVAIADGVITPHSACLRFIQALVRPVVHLGVRPSQSQSCPQRRRNHSADNSPKHSLDHSQDRLAGTT